MVLPANYELCRAEIAAARLAGRMHLGEARSKAFVRALGIACPEGGQVRTAREAGELFEKLAGPCIIKVVSADIPHKTEAGGVVGPVSSASEAVAACETIRRNVARLRPQAAIDGFLVERYIRADVEWILGFRNDRLFGPAVAFGLGGIYVEALQQISFRLAPVERPQIESLLAERPSFKLLGGVRGAQPADRLALIEAIKALGGLATQPDLLTELAEIDINPLIAGPDGVLALDVLVVLNPKEEK